MDPKIKAALRQLGGFFKKKREEMGRSHKELADLLHISVNTLHRIEAGQFAWDMDIQIMLCQALEIKPYFSTTKNPDEQDYRTRKEDDPDRYHGFYISENMPLYPDQLAIVKLTAPRLFIRFNYGDSYFSSYEDWVANHTDLQWLDPEDKPADPEEIDYVLTDCWNFLALHEREEDRLANEID